MQGTTHGATVQIIFSALLQLQKLLVNLNTKIGFFSRKKNIVHYEINVVLKRIKLLSKTTSTFNSHEVDCKITMHASTHSFISPIIGRTND